MNKDNNNPVPWILSICTVAILMFYWILIGSDNCNCEEEYKQGRLDLLEEQQRKYERRNIQNSIDSSKLFENKIRRIR